MTPSVTDVCPGKRDCAPPGHPFRTLTLVPHKAGGALVHLELGSEDREDARAEVRHLLRVAKRVRAHCGDDFRLVARPEGRVVGQQHDVDARGHRVEAPRNAPVVEHCGPRRQNRPRVEPVAGPRDVVCDRRVRGPPPRPRRSAPQQVDKSVADSNRGKIAADSRHRVAPLPCRARVRAVVHGPQRRGGAARVGHGHQAAVHDLERGRLDGLAVKRIVFHGQELGRHHGRAQRLALQNVHAEALGL
mmetsp:Transcript_589/g.1913  ORF Transcript_589/g.1913 Transcript_589/m.1913 type:complete len:246 (-) Transcript_589:1092-1829(-)